MNTHFSIKNASLHLWRVPLAELFSEVSAFFPLLSSDEKLRAERFAVELHQKRFIVTRGVLRRVLGSYLKMPPEEIIFTYGDHGKPFLKETSLSFNISHSEDLAVFAITQDQEVGVDIQKMTKPFKEAVAKRFFSEAEVERIMHLPLEDKTQAFYTLWSQKEALIKLFGKGIFSEKNVEKLEYVIQDFFVEKDYAGAFATIKPIHMIEYFAWEKSGVRPLKDFTC